MEFLRRYRLTALAVIVGLFLVVLAVLFALDPDESAGQRAVGALIAGVLALAVLGGLWLIRSGITPLSFASAAVAIGLVGSLIWWWMIVPALVALAVLWFGIVKRGLIGELRPAGDM